MLRAIENRRMSLIPFASYPSPVVTPFPLPVLPFERKNPVDRVTDPPRRPRPTSWFRSLTHMCVVFLPLNVCPPAISRPPVSFARASASPLLSSSLLFPPLVLGKFLFSRWLLICCRRPRSRPFRSWILRSQITTFTTSISCQVHIR